MKLLVFAHTPPPFHGQSYMVKLMLDGLKTTEPTLEIFHVDAKLSSNLEAIGKFELGKLLRLLRYCVQAYFYRFVHGADTFYYVPAPGLRAAVYRDWLVLLCCRPIFKKIVFHWHAAGVTNWLETDASESERKFTHWALDGADLSVVLSEFARADAAHFSPHKFAIVPNGIPDPCPDFESTILPNRLRRLERRVKGGAETYTILFIGACTGEKGLFATVEGVALFNERLRKCNSSIGLKLIVAGEFASEQEHQQFFARIAKPDLRNASSIEAIVEYRGFVAADAKQELFALADCFCFPTHYHAEGQPVTILEALAFGLPIVTTRWRSIPELLSGAQAEIMDDQNPIAVANALEAMLNVRAAEVNRQIFLDRYEVRKFIDRMVAALTSV